MSWLRISLPSISFFSLSSTLLVLCRYYPYLLTFAGNYHLILVKIFLYLDGRTLTSASKVEFYCIFLLFCVSLNDVTLLSEDTDDHDDPDDPDDHDDIYHHDPDDHDVPDDPEDHDDLGDPDDH